MLLYSDSLLMTMKNEHLGTGAGTHVRLSKIRVKTANSRLDTVFVEIMLMSLIGKLIFVFEVLNFSFSSFLKGSLTF